MEYSDMTEQQLLDYLDKYKGWKPSECSLIVQELRERRKNERKKNCSKRATKYI